MFYFDKGTNVFLIASKLYYKTWKLVELRPTKVINEYNVTQSAVTSRDQGGQLRETVGSLLPTYYTNIMFGFGWYFAIIVIIFT